MATLSIHDGLENIPPVYLLKPWSPSGIPVISDGVLWMQHGTWSTNDLGNGRLIETFTVAAVASENPREIIAEINRLETMFRTAAEYVNPDMNGKLSPIWLIEQVEDETNFRRSLVHSGTINRIDNEVLRRHLNKNEAFFTITVERNIEWEHTDYDTIRIKEIDYLGGNKKIPPIQLKGNAPGRIAALYVAPKSQQFQKLWLGIKHNPNNDAKFNPRIESSNARLWYGSQRFTDSRFVDSQAIRFVFSSSESEAIDAKRKKWKIRAQFPMFGWNSTVAGSEESRIAMIGSYHLLARYTTGPGGNTYGIRALTGWSGPYRDEDDEIITTGMSPLKRVFLNKNLSINIVDLGLLKIGNQYNEFKSRTTTLRSFSIFLEAALVKEDDSGTSDPGLIIDTLYLVPADHSLYVELHDDIKAQDGVEVYKTDRGETFGYVLKHAQFGIDPTRREFVDNIPTIIDNNWAMPYSRTAWLVVVADRKKGNTTERGKELIVSMQHHARTRHYSEL